MPTRAIALLACLAALWTVGCAKDEQGTPAACREGAQSVRRALRAAPGDVRIDGTRLSQCFNDGTDGGALSDVGTSYLTVTTQLAKGAIANPDGHTAVQLGYLIGATKRGGAGSQGISTELMRRLEQELVNVDTGSAAFRRGERAGRSSG